MTKFRVKEGEDREEIECDTVYIAPGGRQMAVHQNKATGALTIEISDGELVGGFKPSVDHLFDSVAASSIRPGVATILTGIGEDGVRGLKNLKMKGYSTIAQDEQSSVVFGMPRRAIEEGAVESGTSLLKIPQVMIESY